MLFTIKYLVIIQQGKKYKVYGGGGGKQSNTTLQQVSGSYELNWQITNYRKGEGMLVPRIAVTI